MTQRYSLEQVKQQGVKRRNENQRAMERTCFRVSKWDQLNWFVRFSNKALDRLTASELDDVQQEIAAIVWETRHYWMEASLTNQQLRALQREIADHLHDFIKRGDTEYGPVNSEHSVIVLMHPDKKHETKATKKFVVLYRLAIRGREDKVVKDHLVIYLFELLKDQGLLLQPCRHCSQIFLKLREHARYCSRQCQSVATMRIKRQRERDENKQKRRAPNGTSGR